MRILLIAERYWPEVGAAPSRLANMAVGLKKEGCDVDVLTGLPNYPKGKIFDGYRGCVQKYEQREGVELFRYWIYATVSRNPLCRIINMFSFAVTMWLFALKRRRINGYDCVIIQTPQLVVAASAMVMFKQLYGKKCILNVSDIWPLTAVDMGAMKMGSASYRFMDKLEHYLYKQADAVLGQSREILDHVAHEAPKNKRLFLYRNLQNYQMECERKTKNKTLKLVFCGMLGVAQDVAGIVKNVPFKELGVEFHIFGGGKQLDEIEDYCKEHPDGMVYAHGYVQKNEIAEKLKVMDASIVPLATRIRGAFPSKVFDILPHGLPVLFCGGGEGANFIQEHQVGMISAPGDYHALTENILRMRDMEVTEYEAMSGRCVKLSQEELDFKKQINECKKFLEIILK